MQPVQRALALWTKYQDYAISRQKVASIFELPLHPQAAESNIEASRDGTLRVERVSFRKSDDAPWLLKDIDLNLNRGECVSISADHSPSLGALLDIIGGIYAPTRGNVIVDGHNALQYRSSQYIDHVGYIESESMIFRGTIRDNLTCFGQIDEAKMREMAALLQIDKDIAALPSGYETYLNGNATDTIPPGLKQRISMVRVLAPKPRIIIFDHADRSLDRAGYNLVHSLLSRLVGKATLIICSDDQNLTAHASRHFHLEDARLAEIDQTNSRPSVRYRELKL